MHEKPAKEDASARRPRPRVLSRLASQTIIGELVGRLPLVWKSTILMRFKLTLLCDTHLCCYSVVTL